MVETDSVGFAVFLDGEKYEPRNVTVVELKGNPQENTVTDQCGRTENFSTGDKGLTMTVEGTLSDVNTVSNNLSKDIFVNEVMRKDKIEIISDLYPTGRGSGEIRVSSPTTITQESGDRNTDQYGNLLFSFTLTLGEEESEGGGGV